MNGINSINFMTNIFTQQSFNREAKRVEEAIRASMLGAPSNSDTLTNVNHRFAGSVVTNSPKPTVDSTIKHAQELFKSPEFQVLVALAAIESGEFPEDNDDDTRKK